MAVGSKTRLRDLGNRAVASESMVRKQARMTRRTSPSHPNPKPAFVISTHAGGLGVIRALGALQIPVIALPYDDAEFGHVSRYVEKCVRVPHPEKFEGQFIDFLSERVSRLGPGILLPTSDAALAAVSRHKRLLDRFFVVACPEWEITERFLDKKNTYALAEAVGVPVPKTVPLGSLGDAKDYGKSFRYPCLVKPRCSHQYDDLFRKKMAYVENYDQMLAEYEKAANAGVEVMLQEWIPGPDSSGANYNSYFWDGEPLVEFTAAKVRNAPPQFGSPRVVVSQRIPELLEPGRRILRAMGFYGYSCTEFKRDPCDGVYKLMEVNGRHNLSSLLAVSCGVNFPWLQYQHLLHGELPSPQDYRTGVYWVDLIRDVGNSMRFFASEKYSLGEYLRPYLRAHVFAQEGLQTVLQGLSDFFEEMVQETLSLEGRASAKPRSESCF